MESQIVPGRTENQVWAELSRALIAGGGDHSTLSAPHHYMMSDP